jgi:hypothetical protein
MIEGVFFILSPSFGHMERIFLQVGRIQGETVPSKNNNLLPISSTYKIHLIDEFRHCFFFISSMHMMYCVHIKAKGIFLFLTPTLCCVVKQSIKRY